MAGIARTGRIWRGPLLARWSRCQASLGIDRKAKPPRPVISGQLAAPTRRPIVFGTRHSLHAFPSLCGVSAQGRGQEPARSTRSATPPGRWRNAREQYAGPTVKTSNPGLAPRGAERAVGGIRAWGRILPQGRLTYDCTPIRAVACADPKSCSNLPRMVRLPPAAARPTVHGPRGTMEPGDETTAKRMRISVHSERGTTRLAAARTPRFASASANTTARLPRPVS